MEGTSCALTVESDCELVRQLAEALESLDPFQAVGLSGRVSCVLEQALGLCHAACPVPPAIVKAVEVAAGLALPADVTIALSR